MSNEITSVNKPQEIVKEVNTIPLKEAQKWAKRWEKKEGNYNKHHELHAFLIPKIDLLEVLAEGIDAVRAYIGVDNEGIEKLMIVGCKYNPATGIYVDMITVGDENVANAIYDVTQPCPPACDANSPMFQ
ncbi:hypothetical protein [Flavobacterium laiguense]|uniref:Uncharacterized protein n=1 Tax=Flavobacterium laiguense TaxID=2169409 RepID=A0A2U1JMF7_9FLAO|nr:hypothetical protein [Flavobacterium laiguense]PWA06038.1 hypothetical protein DB891_16320 [Flavobacterium laiguense]